MAAAGGAARKRLKKELQGLLATPNEQVHNLEVDEANMMMWTALIVPSEAPYNKGAFEIRLEFPDDYPFKPPKLTFVTPIYHPNVDEKGLMCLPIVSADHWKPATKVAQVLGELLDRIAAPDPEHSVREDVGNLFTKDRKGFDKAADEHTRKNGAKRPK